MISSIESHKSQAEGNTIPPRLRRICFTLNNYTDNEYLESQKLSDLMIIGKEIGDKGTPHLQGYAEFKNQKSLEMIKSIVPRAHIEKAKGNRQQNITYCSKGGNYWTTFPEDFKAKLKRLVMERMPVMNRPWQLKILDEIKLQASDRTIQWYWEPVGGIGKSKFCKYLATVHGAQLVPTRTADALHHIQKCLEAEILPEIIVVDVPRCSMEFINYQSMEMIKNGTFSSGKYEGGMCIYPEPHVLVFANEPPNLECMSKDRWNIVRL